MNLTSCNSSHIFGQLEFIMFIFCYAEMIRMHVEFFEIILIRYFISKFLSLVKYTYVRCWLTCTEFEIQNHCKVMINIAGAAQLHC